MSSYLEAVDVCAMTSALETCVEKVSLLEEIMTTGLDRILPIQSRRVHSTEKLNKNCVAHMLQNKNGNKYIVFALKMARCV